ncbi:MAG: outer membrane protein assembly factor [Planctomycetes bacterium]|nr:outer membrane protein assembly factor [Planctomycetota bacterium]
MKNRKSFTLAVALVPILYLLIPAASRCLAQEEPMIAAVEVRGLTSISEAEFRGKIKTRKGSVFSADILAEDITRLAEEGIIVEVTQETRGDEVVIIFNVIAEDITPEVDEMLFEGGPKGDLGDLMHTRRGSKFAEYLVNADSARIAEFFIEKGYSDVTVTPRVEPAGPGKVKVTFVISKGPKFQLKKLEFVGNEQIPRGRLEKVMATKVDTWLTGRKFIARAFKEDITRINWLYVREGYLDAAVEADEPSIDHETGRVEAVIRITEGPRYKIAELNFRGNKAITDDELAKVVGLRPGTFYTFQGLEADVRALTGFCTTGDRGFAAVNIGREIKKGDEPATLLLTFTIDEGKPTYVRRIHTRGNYKTHKKVIVREMRIEPGDMFDSQLITDSERRLQDLRYFTKTDISWQPAPPPKRGAVEGVQYVDLVAEVEETETGRLLVGAGFNSNSALGGQLSVEQRNFDISNLPDFKRYGLAALSPSRSFIGGGQTLRLVAQPGTDRSRYFFEFEEPWLLDYPVEFYLSGYLFERFYDGYTVGRRGGTIGIGKRFTRKFKANIKYRRELVDIGDIDASSPIDAARQEGRHDLGIWRVSAYYDTRDSRIFPTRGGTIGSYAELAGGPAGGNVNFWKYGLNGSLFIKLWEFPKENANVLRLEAETAFTGPAFGDDEVPIYERNFAGGLGSMRGFAYRGIGPRQVGGDQTALGGDLLFLGTAEYIIPLYKEDYLMYIFTDAGTLSSSIRADAFSKLRTAAGLGFRFHLPVMGGVPLEINFGFPIHKEPEDKEQMFNFALGLFF